MSHVRFRTGVGALTAVLLSLVAALAFTSPAQAVTAAKGSANCTITHRDGTYYFCYNDHVTVFGKPKQSLYLRSDQGVHVIVYLKGKVSEQLSSEVWLAPNQTTLVYTNKTGTKKAVEFEVANSGGGPADLHVNVDWCTVSGNQACAP